MAESKSETPKAEAPKEEAPKKEAPKKEKVKMVKFQLNRDLNLGKITSKGKLVHGKKDDIIECEYTNRTSEIIDRAEKDGMIKLL